MIPRRIFCHDVVKDNLDVSTQICEGKTNACAQYQVLASAYGLVQGILCLGARDMGCKSMQGLASIPLSTIKHAPQRVGTNSQTFARSTFVQTYPCFAKIHTWLPKSASVVLATTNLQCFAKMHRVLQQSADFVKIRRLSICKKCLKQHEDCK